MDEVSEAHLPARELPMNCFHEMGIRLSSNVEELAYLLNVDNDTLIKLKTKDNPAREVLEYWANKPDTTALVLRMILQKLKRYDVIRILDKYIKGNFPTFACIVSACIHASVCVRLYVYACFPTRKYESTYKGMLAHERLQFR